MVNANTCFFNHLIVVFLISIFEVRRCNSAYLSCVYVPRLVKFTTFIDESVGKNKLVSRIHEGY